MAIPNVNDQKKEEINWPKEHLEKPPIFLIGKFDFDENNLTQRLRFQQQQQQQKTKERKKEKFQKRWLFTDFHLLIATNWVEKF